MDTDLEADALAADGLPVSDRRFVMGDSGRLWSVSGGPVDVFLVSTAAGEPTGAQHHLVRLAPGQGLYEIGVPPSLAVALVVVCTPDARLTETLRPAADGPPAALALLEGWIAALCAALVVASGPHAPLLLESDTEITLAAPGAVTSRAGVVWVQHLAGSSQFIGQAELPPLTGPGFVPVSTPAWLWSDAGTRLAAVDTACWLQHDPALDGLRTLHQLVAQAHLLRVRAGEQLLHERLQHAVALDARRLDGALRELLTPLDEDTDDDDAVGENLDPWFAACRLIGSRQHIKFRQPAVRSSSEPAIDPLGAILEASNIRARRVALSGGWWRHDNGPLLAALEQGRRPVALLPASARSYRLIDPSSGHSEKVTAQVAATLETQAHVFYRPLPAGHVRLRELLRFGLQGCRRDLRTLLVLSAALSLVGLMLPVLTGIVFDSVVPGGHRSQLLQVGLLLVALAAGSSLFELCRNIAVLRIETTMEAATQAAVWDRLLRLPVPFFRDYSAGDLATRSLGIDAVRQSLTGSTVEAILSGVFSITSAGLLWYYDARLLLVACGLVAVSLLASLLAAAAQLRKQRRLADVSGELSGAVLQWIGGIAKLRISGTENRAFISWARAYAEQKRVAMAARRVATWSAVFNVTFPIVSTTVIFALLLRSIDTPGTDGLTAGQLVAFLATFVQFQGAVLGLSSAALNVLQVVPLYERAKPILEAIPEVDDNRVDPGELTGHLAIKHASFRYRPELPLVLRDVSLTIHAGEFVAIVGPSGGGKSTLMRLLLGFATPEHGVIYFDNRDLVSLDPQAVRRQVGAVLQNGRLLHGTVLQNIVGSSQMTIEDARDAARMAGLWADLEAMPMGMHTIVSDGGGGLSGGQRQRLLIARALAHKPRIVFFDEATSALDNETQAIVTQSLARLKVTRVVIAHRLSTISSADRIIVIDKGEVVQTGRYDDLVNTPGPFSDLAQRQLA